jgi:hypothetical protein
MLYYDRRETNVTKRCKPICKHLKSKTPNVDPM